MANPVFQKPSGCPPWGAGADGSRRRRPRRGGVRGAADRYACEITAIAPHSPAARTKIAPGDILLAINGHEIGDVLDYRFHAAERKLKLELLRGGKRCRLRLKKDEYDDLGLEFADGLMDSQRHCKNKCLFCFIDQLPPGLRESLYFKDDDARLGFLFGNYITLTNLTDHEARRIVGMRLSPVNVSVHTMNPALRCKMMGNPQAGKSLSYLDLFARAGIDLNIQLVLCSGWNDGGELRYTLAELLKLPAVRSIAAVPVGLTKYREGLTALRPFTKNEAQDVIDIFEEIRNSEFGIRNCELCASDEFFLLAEQDMPGVEYYGAFRQIENGVGLWASLKQDMVDLLKTPPALPPSVSRTLATGVAAYPLLRFLVDETQKIWHNIHITARPIENRFFGENITVAGLLTGQDVIAQLSGGDLGEKLLLPAAMFNPDGLTLDGMTLDEISSALGVPAAAVGNGAEEFVKAIM